MANTMSKLMVLRWVDRQATCWLTFSWFSLKKDIDTVIWYRYVDDNFAVSDSKDTAYKFLKFLNLNRTIQFRFQTSSLNATRTTLSLLPYTGRKLSQAYTANGILSLHANTKQISSAPSSLLQDLLLFVVGGICSWQASKRLPSRHN